MYSDLGLGLLSTISVAPTISALITQATLSTQLQPPGQPGQLSTVISGFLLIPVIYEWRCEILLGYGWSWYVMVALVADNIVISFCI